MTRYDAMVTVCSLLKRYPSTLVWHMLSVPPVSCKLYVNCLKVIELAKVAGYPAHLMEKLDQRNANRLKQMRDDP